MRKEDDDEDHDVEDDEDHDVEDDEWTRTTTTKH